MQCAVEGIRFRYLVTTCPKDLSKVIKRLLRSAADRFQGIRCNAVQYTLAMKLKPGAAKSLAGVASNHSFSAEGMDRESRRHCVALSARLALLVVRYYAEMNGSIPTPSVLFPTQTNSNASSHAAAKPTNRLRRCCNSPMRNEPNSCWHADSGLSTRCLPIMQLGRKHREKVFIPAQPIIDTISFATKDKNIVICISTY